MSKVWIVTGSARGLGRSIVEAALAAGDRVVATAREPRSLDNLCRLHPDSLRVVALDVRDGAAAASAVRTAIEAFGRIDVLVNNAGYGHLSPFEQTTEADFRDQIDTNFYGVVNMTRAVLPVMRRQRSGHILQVSSVGGRIGTPGLSAYQSAKWAVGGFTEVLDKEVRPLGIRMVTMEPGGMRTDWAKEAGGAVPVIMADYQSTVGAMVGLLSQYAGHEMSDPAKVAAVVLQIARHDNPPAHLLLGSDAVHFCSEAETQRATQAAMWRGVSLSTDADAAVGIPVLPK